METTVKEDPTQLRLEEPAAVLEVLFDAMTQSERQEALFRQFNNGANLPTVGQVEKDLKLFPAVHKAMDKYSLSALMEGDLLSRMADFLLVLTPDSYYPDVIMDLWLTALRVQHKHLFLTASRCLRNYVGRFSELRELHRYWIFNRPSKWPLAIVETISLSIGLSSYHLLIQAIYSEPTSSLRPDQDRQYWDNFIDRACQLGFTK